MKLLQTHGVPDRKTLSKRSVIIGAEAGFILAVFCQPVIMMLTKQTAIHRFVLEYGFPAWVFAWVTLFCLSVLIYDTYCSISDLRRNTNFTTSKLYKIISRYRGWFILIPSFWSLMMMTTVKAENGYGAVLAYALFFVADAVFGLVLALRDGCIDNRILKYRTALCMNGLRSHKPY
jgi:uncharacterized membrane protein